MGSTTLAFVDTETTGLDPTRHHLWEVAVIIRADSAADHELSWRVRPDLTTADPNAMRFNRYYERIGELGNGPAGKAVLDVDSEDGPVVPNYRRNPNAAVVAADLARLLSGAHLVGGNPAFDAAFLATFLYTNGQAPSWHYHLIDIGAMAQGYQHGRVREMLTADPKLIVSSSILPQVPWKSDALSRQIGVNPDDFERHAALGDARWVRAQWDAMTAPAAPKEQP